MDSPFLTEVAGVSLGAPHFRAEVELLPREFALAFTSHARVTERFRARWRLKMGSASVGGVPRSCRLRGREAL